MDAAQAEMNDEEEVQASKTLISDDEDNKESDEEGDKEKIKEEEEKKLDFVPEKLAGEFKAAEEFKLTQRVNILKEEEEKAKRRLAAAVKIESKEDEGKEVEEEESTKRKRGEGSTPSSQDTTDTKRVKVEAGSGPAVSGLREEDVRQYIISVGGRIALKELSTVDILYDLLKFLLHLIPCL